MLPILVALLVTFHLTAAHFTITYPPWRSSSFIPQASQYIYRCAGITTNSTTNRTAWPLTGGSLLLKVGHNYAFTYINLGLGANTSTFNIPLAAFNQTGNGTFCLPRLAVPAQVDIEGVATAVNITEGGMGTVQVVQIGHSGAALYNCADVTFSSSAQLLGGDICVNTTGVGGAAFAQAAASNVTTSSNSTTTSQTGTAISVRASPSFFVGCVLGLAILLAC